MSRRPEGEGGSARGVEARLRGVQRLAAKLQRAVETGRASPRDLREVDRHLSRTLTALMSDTLRHIDEMLNTTKRSDIKEELGALYVGVTGMRNEFKSLPELSYVNLTHREGAIDPAMLNRLIDLDTELSRLTLQLNAAVQKLDIVRVRKDHLASEIPSLLLEMREILGCRRKLLKENMKG